MRADHLISYINRSFVFLNIKETDIKIYEVKALQILDSDLWKVVPVDFIDEFRTMRKDLLPSGKGSFLLESDCIVETCISSDKKSVFNDLLSQHSFKSSQKSQMPYTSRPKPSIEEKKLTKVENLSLSRRVVLENKISKSLEKVTTLVMKKYQNFSGELQSDIALSMILCARALAGLHTDITSCISLLQNLNFA